MSTINLQTGGKRKPEEKRPLRLIPAIHRAAHRISVYVERDSNLGITQAEAHILTHLWVSGDSTIGRLHSAFGHRRSTLTSILDRLAHSALISRETSKMDRRTFVVSLSSEGKAVGREAYKMLLAVEQDVIAKVNRSEINGFSVVVQAISDFHPKKHQ